MLCLTFPLGFSFRGSMWLHLLLLVPGIYTETQFVSHAKFTLLCPHVRWCEGQNLNVSAKRLLLPPHSEPLVTFCARRHLQRHKYRREETVWKLPSSMKTCYFLHFTFFFFFLFFKQLRLLLSVPAVFTSRQRLEQKCSVKNTVKFSHIWVSFKPCCY